MRHCRKQNNNGPQRSDETVEPPKQPFQTPALRQTGSSYLVSASRRSYSAFISLEPLLQRCETPEAETIFLTISQIIDERFPRIAVGKRGKNQGRCFSTITEESLTMRRHDGKRAPVHEEGRLNITAQRRAANPETRHHLPVVSGHAPLPSTLMRREGGATA